MHGSCKIALYMVLLRDVDGDILPLPVGVRHVKNVRTWLRTLICSSAANSIQSNYILNVACDFYSCSRLQR